MTPFEKIAAEHERRAAELRDLIAKLGSAETPTEQRPALQGQLAVAIAHGLADLYTWHAAEARGMGARLLSPEHPQAPRAH